MATGLRGKTTSQRLGPSAYIGKTVKSSKEFSPRAMGSYGMDLTDKPKAPISGIYLESALANLH